VDLFGKLRENGLLTVRAGDSVIRLLPPLIIDESHIGEALDILDRSCAELVA
jgi:acetylornithine/N-succinyldiaminopimelate aminotransferase